MVVEQPRPFEQGQGLPGPLGGQVGLVFQGLGQLFEQLRRRIRLDQPEDRLAVGPAEVAEPGPDRLAEPVDREPLDQPGELGLPAVLAPLAMVAEGVEDRLGGIRRSSPVECSSMSAPGGPSRPVEGRGLTLTNPPGASRSILGAGESGRSGRRSRWPRPIGPFSLDRMVSAVEEVRPAAPGRRALEAAGVPYAVIGGNAVAAWVARVDEAAVRNTQDVDILLRRADLEPPSPPWRRRLPPSTSRGSTCSSTARTPRPAMPSTSSSPARRSGPTIPAPPRTSPNPSEADFPVLTLPALIRMKLTSFRLKDQVHLLDLIDVGLIDQSTVEATAGRTRRDGCKN